MTSFGGCKPLAWPALRAAVLAIHLVFGVLLAALLAVAGGRYWYRTARGQRLLARWMGVLNAILQLRIRVTGDVCDGPVLLVANHVSWLDIPALAAVAPAVFVAKAEVRRWPLIGWLSDRAGTLFLQRATLVGMRRAIDRLEAELGGGLRCVVFPEGTTTTGDDVAPFRPALYRAAWRSAHPVQPVAIRYCREGSRDAIAPFVGDDAFVPHLWRVLRHGEVEVRLHFCRAVAASAGQRELADATRAAIRRCLQGESTAVKVA
ncbi:MAG: lysophospholipid acyltransferase family protein [Gammaproteobacteria bacterium]